MRSTRWPAEVAAAQNVQMNMKHSLAAMATRINYIAIAILFQPLTLRNLVRLQDQLPHQRRIERFETGKVAIEHDASAQTLRKLSLAVEQSPNAVLITARDGTIEYANPRFFSITGYPPAEVLGKTLRLLQPEEAAQEAQSGLWAAIEAGREWSGEVQCRRKDGSPYWSRDLVSPIVDAEGAVTHFVWLQEDVTESRESLEQIAYQATHDALTGLLNRHEFERRLTQARSQAENGKREHVLCFLDLDQFKIINDTVGHAAGDELLRQISLLLDRSIRKRDCLARFGGDEFAILIRQIDVRHAPHVGENGLAGLARMFLIDLANQDCELVATKARNDVVATHAAQQLVRNLTDQPVAGRVTAGVVDILELIQIDEKQRAGMAHYSDIVDLCLELLDEAAPVE